MLLHSRAFFTASSVALVFLFICVFVNTIFISQVKANISQDLVAHWAFDEGSGTSAADSVGSNNGTLVGGGGWGLGKYGQAVILDGSDDYINLGTSNSLKPTSALSLSLWVKATDIQGSAVNRTVISSSVSNVGYSLDTRGLGGGAAYYRAYLGSWGVTVQPAQNLQNRVVAGTFQHVVMAWDGNTLQLYIDGVLIGSVAAPSIAYDTTSAVQLGRYANWPNVFKGAIDDVRLYNRALTAQEVLELYNNTPPSGGNPPAPDEVAPSTPTNLSATTVSSSQINLSWSTSSDNVGVAGYHVFRDATHIATTTTPSYNNTGLTASTTHTFSIRAFDVAGNTSSTSVAVSTSTFAASAPPPPPPPPPAPTTLQVVGTLVNPHIAGEGVAVQGRYAYVAGRNTSALSVVDITDPTRPVLSGTVVDVTLLAGAEDLFIAGHYVYVTTEAGTRLTIVDVSKASQPTIVGSVSDPALLLNTEDVYVVGRYAYVTMDSSADRLTIVDVSNPAAPFIVGSLQDAARLDAPEGVHVAGNFAYIAVEGGSRLTIVDVSNPQNPVVVGSILDTTRLAAASGISVVGRYAYVTAENSGAGRFTIVDVSNPFAPIVVGSTPVNDPDNQAVAGDYAYVTDTAGALHIIDITDPTNPSEIDTLSGLPNQLVGIALSGRYAYVLGTSLAVVDIGGTSPSTLFTGALYTSALEAGDYARIGNDLFVGGGGVFGSHVRVDGSVAVSGALGVSTLVSCGSIQTNVQGIMTCASDARLKNISAPFTAGLDAIRALSPQIYSWSKESGYYDGAAYAGFIAQDVAKVLPQAISTREDGYLQVNTTSLLAAVVNAVKELAQGLETALAAIAGFGESFTTKELCVSNDQGEKTCLTKAKLDRLVEERAPSPNTFEISY